MAILTAFVIFVLIIVILVLLALRAEWNRFADLCTLCGHPRSEHVGFVHESGRLGDFCTREQCTCRG